METILKHIRAILYAFVGIFIVSVGITLSSAQKQPTLGGSVPVPNTGTFTTSGSSTYQNVSAIVLNNVSSTVSNGPQTIYATSTIANLANGTTATTTGSYYPTSPGYWYMDGYKDFSLDMTFKDATGTVECTNDYTALNWFDITPAGYNKMTNSAGATTFSSTPSATSTYFVDWSNVDASLCRLKVINLEATSTASIVVHLKKLY